MGEERITYQTLRADGDSHFYRCLDEVYAEHGTGPTRILPVDLVILRVIGRRVKDRGAFRPVSVEIVT